MSIYVIGDLHLSFTSNKPMDIYGGEWINHAERVKAYWSETVTDQDTVIIAGDISWGLKLEEAMADLQWIDSLPGHKVLFKGNHDLWWNGIGKLNKLFESITFIQNTCYELPDTIICGSRGWTCPGDAGFTADDQKIYLRELGRLKLSLDAGEKVRKNTGGEYPGEKELIGVLHYPPTNEKLENSGFTELFSQYRAGKVVYGHLHGRDAYKNGLQGVRDGVEYILTSCDKLSCRLLKLK